MTESVHRAASVLVCRSCAAIRKTHAAALMTAAPRPFKCKRFPLSGGLPPRCKNAPAVEAN
jgi:hypothetical protein